MAAVTLWLISHGISQEILILFVFISIIVTLTAFSRYVLGIKTFGIYNPLILSIAFYYMGLFPGLIATLIVISATQIARIMTKDAKLHYLARLSITYILSTFAVFFVVLALNLLPGVHYTLKLDATTALALAGIISLSDRFVATYTKKDTITAVRLLGETILISTFGWLLLYLPITRSFMLNNLWIPFLFIALGFLVGRYSGLRLTEFVRFNKVIQNVEHPQDTK